MITISNDLLDTTITSLKTLVENIDKNKTDSIVTNVEVSPETINVFLNSCIELKRWREAFKGNIELAEDLQDAVKQLYNRIEYD